MKTFKDLPVGTYYRSDKWKEGVVSRKIALQDAHVAGGYVDSMEVSPPTKIHCKEKDCLLVKIVDKPTKKNILPIDWR